MFRFPPTPSCRHGEKAFLDREVGTLDDNHIYCPCCGYVVCFNAFSVREKFGVCGSCGVSVSETIEKDEDGIGKIVWHKYNAMGDAIDGGTL